MRPTGVAGFLLLAVCAAGGLRAQTAKAPSAYTVTQAGGMMAPTATTIVYRDGSKALIDLTNPPGSHVRTLYDLQAGRSISWSVDNATDCSNGTFSGNWGDPFADSADLTAQVASGQVKEVGTETVNGMAAKVFEAGGGKIKAWVDSKYGLMLKMQMTGPDGKQQTMEEVKQVSFTAPPASTFALPAACSNLPAPPPTEAQRIAAETGGKAENYANGILGPGSANSCTVLVKFVRAGSLQPIAGGFQFALDKTYDVDHPPSYSIGVGVNGHLMFAGGAIRELTADFRNGVLRIDDAPKQFYVDAAFGNGGEAGGLIYRHCFRPQTELLLVVKNPAKLSDGADWLWVK